MGRPESIRLNLALARVRENSHYMGLALFTSATALSEAFIAYSWPHPTLSEVGLTAISAVMTGHEFISSTKATADRSAMETRIEVETKSSPLSFDGQSKKQSDGF